MHYDIEDKGEVEKQPSRIEGTPKMRFPLFSFIKPLFAPFVPKMILMEVKVVAAQPNFQTHLF